MGWREDNAEISNMIYRLKIKGIFMKMKVERRELEDMAFRSRMVWELYKIKQRGRELEERYNHNHDPKTGQFTSGNGLTGGKNGDRINSARGFLDDDHELFPGSVNAEQLINELQKTEIGRHALEYIKSHNIVVKMEYEKPYHFDRGQQDGNIITLFMANIGGNPLVAAQTVAHEVCHHEYGIGGDQWAEAVCFCHEKMLKENRTWLTFSEKRKMIQLAKSAYPELKWKEDKNGNAKK